MILTTWQIGRGTDYFTQVIQGASYVASGGNVTIVYRKKEEGEGMVRDIRNVLREWRFGEFSDDYFTLRASQADQQAEL